MQRFWVTSKGFKYSVNVGCGAWRALADFPQDRYSSIFILTERHLWERWGEKLLREGGVKSAQPLFVPPGENSKSVKMVEEVGAELLKKGADRRSLLVAFGGGVVGDLGGFVASTYMRGIDCLQVPTTVLAQVDSSIGGKTAVNVGAMKNLLGTFYPPRMVLAEPTVLASLDERSFRSGFFEVAKHAILSGPGLFKELEAKASKFLPKQARDLEEILARAAKVKVEVVSRDEREAGLRRVLNLGHTFGHALEEASGYRRFLHGEAVGWGILIVSRLAELLGVLEHGEGERIARLVRQVSPLPTLHGLRVRRILELLPQDKKAVRGRIHWVIPERIGKVRISDQVPMNLVEAAFRDVQRGGWHE
ncbi:MAG: 3-dehydroquinate synthase [Terriglobia bacterium]|jgi:3-dehydroquinate synthase